MQILEYPLVNQRNFLVKHKYNHKVMNILVEEAINNQNIDEAIALLNENKEIHGDTYSLENNLLLFELYKVKDDKYNAIEELKNILYDYTVKDISYVKELKNLTLKDTWNNEKEELIEFYKEINSYDFLNEIYLLEEDYENLFNNIKSNCDVRLIEEYKKYLEEDYSSQILKIYKDIVLKEAMNSKNISGYTLIIHYLNLMLGYKNSFDIVKNVIKVLKNKYNQRKVFMEKLEEFEIINSLD